MVAALRRRRLALGGDRTALGLRLLRLAPRRSRSSVRGPGAARDARRPRVCARRGPDPALDRRRALGQAGRRPPKLYLIPDGFPRALAAGRGPERLRSRRLHRACSAR